MIQFFKYNIEKCKECVFSFSNSIIILRQKSINIIHFIMVRKRLIILMKDLELI